MYTISHFLYKIIIIIPIPFNRTYSRENWKGWQFLDGYRTKVEEVLHGMFTSGNNWFATSPRIITFNKCNKLST